MNQEVQNRILYHVEAAKISEENAAKDIAFLEKYKNYRPSNSTNGDSNMEKTYLKNGNRTTRGNHYCKRHFIEVHKRAPGISDKATFRCCVRCLKNEGD